MKFRFALATAGLMVPLAAWAQTSEMSTEDRVDEPVVSEAQADVGMDAPESDVVAPASEPDDPAEEMAEEIAPEVDVIAEDVAEAPAPEASATEEAAVAPDAVEEPVAMEAESDMADEAAISEPEAEEAAAELDEAEEPAATEPESDMAEETVVSEPETEEVAAEPEAPAEPDPLEIAAVTCLEIAGPADAGVPAAAVDAASQKKTLAEAAPFCTEAAMADDADPQVLFHAAAIAQASDNTDQTYDLLVRAAEQGLGPAETRLGDYFLFGVGAQGRDMGEAVAHYQAAAALDDPAGMTTLALLHQVGQGVPADTSRMIELMTGAADQGYHFAQYRLAQTYYRGEGVPGRADAALGIPDPEQAVRYYTQAANAGNLSAALELSELYADPNSGLPDNPEEQVRLTRIVSQSGHPPAIARMGVFYETGRGVEKSAEIAAGLYVRAMETGKVDFGDLRAGAPGTWDRDTALAFQAILQERGLYRGPLDAIVGGGTAAAARQLAGN